MNWEEFKHRLGNLLIEAQANGLVFAVIIRDSGDIVLTLTNIEGVSMEPLIKAIDNQILPQNRMN